MSERTDSLIAELAVACIGMHADVIGDARHDLRESIAALERENAELRESEHESDTLRMSLSYLLTRIAVAVKGEPPPLTLWGWDDLPEVVAKQAERIKALETHIQEAADGHASELIGYKDRSDYDSVQKYKQCLGLRDFHLAALEPKEPVLMSEPTKEAIEESIRLRVKFCAPNGRMSSFEVAGLIAYIRTQATNDTHEANAVTCCETAKFFGAQTERGRTLIAMAKALRAMKVPT